MAGCARVDAVRSQLNANAFGMRHAVVATPTIAIPTRRAQEMDGRQARQRPDLL